ncbi:MAG: aspartate kinase [Bacteroidales bacterium]|nr:aspartate kinase [Bacteroidales bacterium]
MIVFKFGGASVKEANAVRNVASVLNRYPEDKIVVVISAMGKTTNAMEVIVDHYFHGRKKELIDAIQERKKFHLEIVNDLFPDPKNRFHSEIEALFGKLEERLEKPPTMNYDFDYDQIVPYGELISTTIVSAFLNDSGLDNQWIDIRKYLKSNNTFREARIDWELSEKLMTGALNFKKTRLYITQGFIASTINDITTTLGREGSDFTAAIIAHLLRAEYVTIWKDVPGVLNADPKWFDNTIKLDKISYLDAIELAYYGASVIHPKTIKPLQNRNINLYIKSFIHPGEEGTLVGNLTYDKLIPSFIFNMDQVLIRISPKDFSFIAEDSLETIFGYLSKHGVKIELMQNSAVSFQICINNDKRKVRNLIDDLEKEFKVTYETGLELITIRYFDQSTIDRVMINKELLLKQTYKQNIQLIVRDKG